MQIKVMTLLIFIYLLINRDVISIPNFIHKKYNFVKLFVWERYCETYLSYMMSHVHLE